MTKDDLIGVTLGDCEILRKLGEGGMGTVYLADHKTLDLQVAVKVLDTDLNKDSEFIERFKREAQQTARLDHPNIMRIFGVSEAKGMHFMISAFIDGPTLEQMLKNQVMSEDKAIAYILQVLNGLEYAHKDNIIHRDIKPSNIMVNRNDEVKITDFGLVRSLDTDISITKTGVPLGTPAFMSPEQWENKGIDQRADVFSVAVTLYKLLSNKYPFEGDSSISIYRSIATGEIIPIRRWQPDIDPELERILQKGMRPNKDTRYQTAYNFAVALKKYLLKTSDTPTKFLAMYPFDVLDDKYRDSSDFKNKQQFSAETQTFSGKKYENLAQKDQTPVTPNFYPIFDPVAQENKLKQNEFQTPTPTNQSSTASMTPSLNTPMLDEIDVKNLQTLNKFIKFRRIGFIFFLLIFFLLIGNLIGSHKSNQMKQEEFEEVSAFVKAQLGTAKDCDEYIRKYPNGRYKDDAEQLRKLKIQLEKNALKEESTNALKETRDGWILDGTMTLKAGIHTFPGKFVISDKSLLKIEAGAVIEFDKKSSIVCYGVIKGEGKPGNPIKFAAKNEKEGWQGISFIGDKSSDSYLEYCILSNGHGVPLHNQNGILTFVDFETDEQTHYGGALVIFNNANIKLTNCTFMNNQSNAGGGAVLCSGARPRFMSCSFINNKVDYNANNSFGGAILVQKESLIEIFHCQFRDNSATFGGAIYVEYSNPYIYDTHFQNNGITDEPSVESYGGAIYITKSNGFTLFDSSFKENGATKSGGALYYIDSESYILNARFNSNSVTSKDGYGGAMSYEDRSRLALIGCTFERNTCEGKGGAMYIGRNTETAIHVAFILGNVADEGAGMYIEDETKMSFMGVKIIRNNATTKGGGILKKKEAMPYMDNTVIEENTPDQILDEE